MMYVGNRPRAVVGRDPRASGEMLRPPSARVWPRQVSTLSGWVIAHPGRRILTADHGADFSVMISASHNPDARQRDQFAAGGHKSLTMSGNRSKRRWMPSSLRPIGARGGPRDAPDAADRYRKHLASIIGHSLHGDGWSSIVPMARHRPWGRRYADAGAKVIAIHSDPDGVNINDGCGSTHLDKLRRPPSSNTVPIWAWPMMVTPTGARSHRSTGAVVDGDMIMAILANAMIPPVV